MVLRTLKRKLLTRRLVGAEGGIRWEPRYVRNVRPSLKEPGGNAHGTSPMCLSGTIRALLGTDLGRGRAPAWSRRAAHLSETTWCRCAPTSLFSRLLDKKPASADEPTLISLSLTSPSSLAPLLAPLRAARRCTTSPSQSTRICHRRNGPLRGGCALLMVPDARPPA